jgi:hypothetical protein
MDWPRVVKVEERVGTGLRVRLLLTYALHQDVKAMLGSFVFGL